MSNQTPSNLNNFDIKYPDGYLFIIQKRLYLTAFASILIGSYFTFQGLLIAFLLLISSVMGEGIETLDIKVVENFVVFNKLITS